MKRTIVGTEAFSLMMKTPLPEKTDTYTPIAHADIINKIKEEIDVAGYRIIKEDYRVSNNGQVASGSFVIDKEDADIFLTVNFVNSYNKQYAFRFNLGAWIKKTDSAIMLDKFGSYKRVHKGNADILAEHKISEILKDTTEYWDVIVMHKNMFMSKYLSQQDFYYIIGKLFFDKKSINTLQLNMIQKELDKPTLTAEMTDGIAWRLYNVISMALKESSPHSWFGNQIELHNSFCELLSLPYMVVPEEEPELKVTTIVPEEVKSSSELAEESWIKSEGESIMAKMEVAEEIFFEETHPEPESFIKDEISSEIKEGIKESVSEEVVESLKSKLLGEMDFDDNITKVFKVYEKPIDLIVTGFDMVTTDFLGLVNDIDIIYYSYGNKIQTVFKSKESMGIYDSVKALNNEFGEYTSLKEEYIKLLLKEEIHGFIIKDFTGIVMFRILDDSGKPIPNTDKGINLNSSRYQVEIRPASDKDIIIPISLKHVINSINDLK